MRPTSSVGKESSAPFSLREATQYSSSPRFQADGGVIILQHADEMSDDVAQQPRLVLRCQTRLLVQRQGRCDAAQGVQYIAGQLVEGWAWARLLGQQDGCRGLQGTCMPT